MEAGAQGHWGDRHPMCQACRRWLVLLGRHESPTGQSRSQKMPFTETGPSSLGPSLLPQAGQKPLLQDPPLSDLEVSGQPCHPVMLLEVRVSSSAKWLATQVFMPCCVGASSHSLFTSPPSLASEYHLSLQPSSATPACLLPGNHLLGNEPASMTCTRGKERFLPLA